MRHLLIAQMGNKCRRRKADRFVVALETFFELYDEPLEQELSHVRKFGVDYSNHRRIYWSEWQACSLRLHDAAAEQSPASDQVFAKQLGYDELDVRDINFVDQSIY